MRNKSKNNTQIIFTQSLFKLKETQIGWALTEVFVGVIFNAILYADLIQRTAKTISGAAGTLKQVLCSKHLKRNSRSIMCHGCKEVIM